MLWELMRLYDWRIITCPTPAFEMLGEVGHVGLYSSLGMRLGTLIHDESTAAFTVPQSQHLTLRASLPVPYHSVLQLAKAKDTMNTNRQGEKETAVSVGQCTGFLMRRPCCSNSRMNPGFVCPLPPQPPKKCPMRLWFTVGLANRSGVPQ